MNDMKQVQLNPDCRFICLKCGKEDSLSLNFHCKACNGLIACDYPDTAFSIDMRYSGIWRFHKILPILFHPFYDCTETPLIPLVEGEGILYGKNEGVLPSISTKYRQCVMSVPSLIALGCKEVTLVSSGNTGSSYMYWANQVQGALRVHIFASTLHAQRLYFTNPYATVHVAENNLSAADEACMEFSKKEHIFYEGGFFNPFRREGLKTSYLESLLRMDWDVDVFIQAVSSGMGIIGFHSLVKLLYKQGFIKKIPKIVCVQQDTCQPMCLSYTEGADEIIESYIPEDPVGSAKAILRSNPKKSYPYVKQVVDETKGCFCMVTQDEIEHSFNFLAKKYVNACHTSAATVAAFEKLKNTGWIQPGDRCVAMLTGGLYHGQDL
ncbi:pyridoxal-phosphate dependent enzyme [Legionella quateirensis]|uniref:Threonine synthase n=1 Tax=Legionella quateirensis TaxID=45072 RepID=A0A378KSJ7_9GAMM|nr:pyridoxal-phosphate dependent enzyme [Legionella quateirensis]KTD50910.1 Threonine synthase [Legionella quateirensis]STY17844.1 Threonine synthase [Legionella quateirensis]